MTKRKNIGPWGQITKGQQRVLAGTMNREDQVVRERSKRKYALRVLAQRPADDELYVIALEVIKKVKGPSLSLRDF